MNEQLSEIRSQFEGALERLRRLDGGWTNEEWLRRPAEDSWSAAECVAHLNLTSRAYLPLLTKAIQEARTVGGKPPVRLRRDPIGWLIWRSTRPEARVRVKTKAAFVPGGADDKTLLVGEFERLQREQLKFLEAVEGLPIQRVKMVSPFDGRVRYSLYSGFTILPAHQHRHLGQAERALAQARVRRA